MRSFHGGSGRENDFNCCDRWLLFRILFLGPQTVFKPAMERIIILGLARILISAFCV